MVYWLAYKKNEYTVIEGAKKPGVFDKKIGL
jgi:hypothetical protein